MTPLYQDTVGPSQHIYAYSQEMGASVTRPLPESSPVHACLGPNNQGYERTCPSFPTSDLQEAFSQPEDDPRLTMDPCSWTGVRGWDDGSRGVSLAEFRKQVWQKSINCPDRNQASWVAEIRQRAWQKVGERAAEIRQQAPQNQAWQKPGGKAWDFPRTKCNP